MSEDKVMADVWMELTTKEKLHVCSSLERFYKKFGTEKTVPLMLLPPLNSKEVAAMFGQIGPTTGGNRLWKKLFKLAYGKIRVDNKYPPYVELKLQLKKKFRTDDQD